MKAVLAYDLGASSGRGILSKFDGKQIHMEVVRRFSDYTIESNGRLQWDVPYIFNEILKGMQTAEHIENYDSIAIDTWGVDFGLLDAQGEIIENPYHYRDRRTKGQVDQLQQMLDAFALYQKTGIQTMEINTLFQLLALKEQHPDIYARTEKILMMPDLLNYLLTGTIACERTIASTTQLYNPQRKDWDYELIKAVGLRPSLFPTIIDPGTEVGPVKPRLLEEWGLSSKKVIAVGSHDTASAIFCTPPPQPHTNTLFLSSGTWSLMGTERLQPLLTETAYRANLSNETGVGNHITLLKNITGLWLIQETKRQFEREGRTYSFEDLAQLAEETKPIACYFDTDRPELTVPGDIPKRIRILAKKTGQAVPGTDGETVRTIYENLALKYRQAYEEIHTSTDQDYQHIHIVGGGSNADFLTQCTANALQLETITGFPEATALGNSAVQLVAINAIASLAEARNIIQKSGATKTYHPQAGDEWVAKYQQYHAITTGQPILIN